LLIPKPAKKEKECKVVEGDRGSLKTATVWLTCNLQRVEEEAKTAYVKAEHRQTPVLTTLPYHADDTANFSH
jgi:hypothetical protein